MTDRMVAAAKEYRFIVAGGDRRNDCLLEALKTDGFRAGLYRPGQPYGAAEGNVFLFAPAETLDRTRVERIGAASVVFCFGLTAEAAALLAEKNCRVHRYLDDEALAHKNAALTAEGALALVIRHTETALKDTRILILGGGRVGKACAILLSRNRCRVTLASRDANEVSQGVLFAGETAELGAALASLSRYDAVVNTIPQIYVKGETLARVKKHCYLLDLASKPGGIDLSEAQGLGLVAEAAPGLPGKCAPRTAAIAIKESVLTILSGQV
ncbi:MAG: hypothetical protein LBH24_05680 [Clostridiales bacterium]|jgi:dipicolinate synthase subunit A|nr:hypothetical protein [Clostridiales bacterium]